MSHVTPIRNRARTSKGHRDPPLERGKTQERTIRMYIVDKTKNLVWIKVFCCRQPNPLQATMKKTVLTKGYSTVSRKATQAWQLPIGIVELKIARPEEMRNQSLKEWFSKCVLRPAGSASTGHLVEIQILRPHRRQQH